MSATPAPTYPPRMPEATPLPGPTTTATVAPQPQERLPETGSGDWDVILTVAAVLVVIGVVAVARGL